MSWVGRIGRGSRQEVKWFCLSLEQGWLGMAGVLLGFTTFPAFPCSGRVC